MSGLYARAKNAGSPTIIKFQTGLGRNGICKVLCCRPVARLYGLWGNTLSGRQDVCFYYMFKTNFSGHNKSLGGTASKCRPVATGLICCIFQHLFRTIQIHHVAGKRSKRSTFCRMRNIPYYFDCCWMWATAFI